MNPIKQGDTITARSRGDALGVGQVHTVDVTRFFIQLRLPNGARSTTTSTTPTRARPGCAASAARKTFVLLTL